MTALQVYQLAMKAIWIAAKQDLRKLPSTPAAYRAALPLIVETYGYAASVAGADFYDSMRQDAGLTDVFEPVFPELGDFGTDELVKWAKLKSTSPETFPALVEAGMQRRVANFARETITQTASADHKARGWMRIGSPECTFCAMLISRGAVYTKETAKFASHDDCDCLAVPAFDKSQVRKVESEFVPSARRKSVASADADKERAKKWMGDNL